MKKLILGFVTILAVTLLSACTGKVVVTPGKVDVQYDNIHYEGDSVVLDIWITNGTSEDVDLGYVEFWLDFPDDFDRTKVTVTEFCGSGFDINDTVKSNGYQKYELEFTSEYIFLTPQELTDVGLQLSDLVLYFNYEQ